MSLAQIFESMQALIVGAESHEAAAIKLYGDARSLDAQRLTVYRHHYLWKLDTSTNGLFPITRRIVMSRIGLEGWRRLQVIVGREHPFPNIAFSTAGLVTVLAGPHAQALGLPAWLGELADLELYRRRLNHAPDPPAASSPDGGLRVARPHFIREYQHDVNQVRRAPDPTTVEPPVTPTTVILWRTADGRCGSGTVNPIDLRIVAAIDTTGSLDVEAFVAESNGALSTERVRSGLAKLLEFGLVQRVHA